MSTEAIIKAFICERFSPDINPDELDLDYDLLENGVISSLELLQFVSWIGETFDIPVDDLSLAPESFGSVRKVTEFIAVNSRNSENIA
jgi:acyl carrier protein